MARTAKRAANYRTDKFKKLCGIIYAGCNPAAEATCICICCYRICQKETAPSVMPWGLSL
jgi:hypothetical protein